MHELEWLSETQQQSFPLAFTDIEVEAMALLGNTVHQTLDTQAQRLTELEENNTIRMQQGVQLK